MVGIDAGADGSLESLVLEDAWLHRALRNALDALALKISICTRVNLSAAFNPNGQIPPLLFADKNKSSPRLRLVHEIVNFLVVVVVVRALQLVLMVCDKVRFSIGKGE